jgi:GNAT superfamily N-acetyltransferase
MRPYATNLSVHGSLQRLDRTSPGPVSTPLPAIELRSARRDELAVVQRLAHIVWHAHYPGIIPQEQIDYMLARGYAPEVLAAFQGRPDRGLELAVVDGEPAGFAAWCVTDDPVEAKLDRLYVLQSRQRYGLGGQLIRRVEDLARAAGATTLILNVNKHNAQAIRAYQKHGFAIRAAAVNDIGNGFVMDDYEMALNIRV